MLQRCNGLFRRLTLGVGFMVAIATAGTASAEMTLKLGWTTADSKVDPYSIMAHYFAEEIEKAAPGDYKVQFYANHQLGNEDEMLQGLQLGTLELSVITGTFIGNIVPSFQLNDLPFLYASNEQAHAVLDGKVGELMFKQLLGKGIVGLGFAEAGFRDVINNKRPINVPEDLSGIRLRVQPSEIFLDSFRALGANPVPMPWSDVFTAVQQGTIDGLEIPLAVIYANKYPEVTKYLSLTNHSYNAPVVLVSGRAWKKLDASQQEVMRKAARIAIDRQRKTVAANDSKVLQDIKDAGMQVNTVPDLSVFRARVSSVYDKYRSSIGAEILDTALGQAK